jgi:dephospho-CoA kinase
MFTVALTGGIATGKSYVLDRLKARAIPAIDSDDVVHDALGPDTPITRAIEAQFGAEYLDTDGSVNRPLLAATVFSKPEARRQLEAIVHPAVYSTIRAWFAALSKPFAVASIPLLYESGREGDFDFVAVTVCAPPIQLRRLMARDGMTETEARKRISAQMPAEEKAARGNFVIRTDGDTASTDRQVDELLAVLEKLTDRT